ncbi:hypothetical protein [Clostridium intestinale]|uniref:hypothetical protein n=1 Tax=Clostridium intestinale TaxID=36845 RepID=UPI002DD6A45C|nr:hypothetical protein [Clostridium intestinale]WRY52611.1 Ig-like domain-containing protein [Clostridium intestinale]
MKKKLGLFLGVLLAFTFMFSVFGNGEVANAASGFTGHYDDVLIGTRNLNNTSGNSAKLKSALFEPEIGWKRYDDSNSKIYYNNGYFTCYDNFSGTYKGTTRDHSGSGGKVKIKFQGSKFRLIGNGMNPDPARNENDEYYRSAKVYTDGVAQGYVHEAIYGRQSRQLLTYEYNFGTYGVHEIEIVKEKVSGIISVDAIDIDGELLDAVNYDPILNIESPITNNTYTGSFNLSGYSINQSGIQSVKTYIDDVYSRDAQIGIQRSDILAKYPSYTGAANSGFSTTYNVSDFSLGTHTMKVQAVGNNGTIKEQLLYLYVYSNYIIVQSTNEPQKITNTSQLKAGDIISLRCTGTTEGNRWLDGKTEDASVWLAPSTGGIYSGTKWQVYSVNGYYALKCLGTYEGKGWRWLDGNTANNVVALAPDTGVVYSGTQWNILSNGDGTFGFQCMGTTPGNRWLDGNTATNVVSLAPFTGGQYSGTKWEIYKAN